ncbi:MAG: ATPase domain-containing protein, partial [Candidatus Binataceae bacterium]
MAAGSAAIGIAVGAVQSASEAGVEAPVSRLQLLDISEVFRGYELTRKDRRLPSGLALLDHFINGGIARGRLSEILGAPGSGRTTLAASFAASATRRGEVIAWIDATGAFDPASVAAAGVELSRVLWVSLAGSGGRADTLTPAISREVTGEGRWQIDPRHLTSNNGRELGGGGRTLKAAEMVLKAGGFGLLVIDFGEAARPLTQSAALRLARAAERCGAAVVVVSSRRLCGTFSALSLSLVRSRARFSQLKRGAPMLFDGFTFQTRVARNKLGPMGQRVSVHAMVDPVLSESWEAQMSAPSPS